MLKGVGEVAANLRVGRVSSVDYENGMMRVVYNDKGKAVTANLPYCNWNNEYRMPQIGEMVMTAHLSNGTSRGVVVGTFWNRKNQPHEYGQPLYRKDLSKIPGAAIYRYDDDTGEYLLKIPIIEINAIDSLLLDGPETRIEAINSITLETAEGTVKIPLIHLSAGEDADEIEIDTEADIDYQSPDNALQALIKQAVLEVLEDLSVEAGTEMTVKSGAAMSLNAGSSLTLEDANNRTTLDSILSRLQALDGMSAKK